ncbi:polyamine transporter 4 [Colletotrichum karsti]|uniref:Polyamine transporter 4 n=1 Tax=Colletotrichum karsti TaxID=1095194 RepID=A0A9P6LGF6_9PEZI|nr:polyamine transporter 4 [Colletotrichum karsti]KAF9872131.1 polyamine transporter 4 [Colletotrichum karsti]
MTSLISLPVEVLDQILGYLTPHQQLHDIKVMKPSIENIAYQQDKKFKLPGLLNLSITCKTLGRMIQPIIFHSFVQHDNFWNNDDSPPAFLHHLGKFLRTLVERPDLAQVVQIVDIEIFDQRCDCCYNTLDRMTEEETIWIAEYSAKTGLPMDTSDTSTIATLATQRESNTWDSWDVAEALIQNLLLMTPNLSRLNLCLPRDWNFKPLMEWSRHIDLKTGSRPEFLQNVRHMELEIQVDDSNDRSIFGPCQEAVAKEFEVSEQVAILGTSLFLLGYVFGPLIIGPLSEKFGRKYPLIGGVALSSIFGLMPALGKNIETILIGRFLSGFFGVAPIAVIGGVISDCWDAAGRGAAMATCVCFIMSGPTIGPIIGGAMIENSINWRWTMWLVCIAGFALCLLGLLTMEESYPPRILQLKARSLRKETGTCNIRSALDNEGMQMNYIVRVYLIRPWRKDLPAHFNLRQR